MKIFQVSSYRLLCYICTLLLCLATGCNKKGTGRILDRFPNSEMLSPCDSLDLETFGIIEPIAIAKIDSILVISTKMAPYGLTLINLKDSTVINCIHKGRGPGEMTFFKTWSIANDTVIVYDSNLKKRINIFITPSIIGKQYSYAEELIDVKPKGLKLFRPVQLLPFHNGYLVTGLFDPPFWYGIIDNDYELVSTVDINHFKELTKLKSADMTMIHQTSYLSVNPSGDRIVSVMLNADVISFTEVNNNNIHEYLRIVDSSPSISLTRISGLPVLTHDEDSSHSFVDVDSNDNHVYLLYSGKKILDEAPAYECYYLLVMTWSGEFVTKYKLSHSLRHFRLCGDKIIGCSSYPNAKMYVYEIPM